MNNVLFVYDIVDKSAYRSIVHAENILALQLKEPCATWLRMGTRINGLKKPVCL